MSHRVKELVDRYRYAIARNDTVERDRILKLSETNKALRRGIEKVNHEVFVQWVKKQGSPDTSVYGRRR